MTVALSRKVNVLRHLLNVSNAYIWNKVLVFQLSRLTELNVKCEPAGHDLLLNYCFQLMLCVFRFLFNDYNNNITVKFYNYLLASASMKKMFANFNTIV